MLQSRCQDQWEPVTAIRYDPMQIPKHCDVEGIYTGASDNVDKKKKERGNAFKKPANRYNALARRKAN